MHWRAKHTFLMQSAQEFFFFIGIRFTFSLAQLLLFMVRKVVTSWASAGMIMLLLDF